MTLRFKTIFAILINIIALIFTLQFVFSKIILNDFELVERAQMTKQVIRAQDALQSRIDALPIRMLDWASWDDTYTFMKDRNSSYYESNLVTSGVVGLEINYFLYISNDQKIIYSKSMDYRNNADTEFPKIVQENLISALKSQKNFNDNSSLSGLLRVDDKVLLFAIRPILTSENKGPKRGALIWARYLTDEEIALISASIKLPVTVQSFNASLEKVNYGVRIDVINQDEIGGTILTKDFYGNPIFHISVKDSRTILAQGLKTKSSVIFSVIIVSLVFGIACLIALEFTLLDRIRKLSNQLVGIRKSKDVHSRVYAFGSDEIGLLGYEINNTLEALEENQNELIRSRKIAQDATQAKSNFVSTMSHEIRTPLNGIIGIVNYLKSKKLPDNLLNHFQIVEDCANSLSRIVNEVLDLSKIEAGKMSIELVNFDIRSEIRRVLNTVSAKADEKNLSLISEIDQNIPQFLVGDPTKLGQVLINLLSNGIKFTERGSVELQALCVGTSTEFVSIKFTVKDTGIGIPIDSQGKIFEAFAQADSSISRRFGGTGLGLSISKDIVSLMGSELTFQSTPNIGTKFEFTINLKVADCKELDNVDFRLVPSSNQLQILVVDDVKTNLTVAKLILEEMGHKVECASSGQEAIFKLTDYQDKGKCDLVFMDLQMPVMSGLDATRHIKNNNPNFNIPIVALTANNQEQFDNKSDSDFIFSGWLTKPLNIQKINFLLNQLFSGYSCDKSTNTIPKSAECELPYGIDKVKLLNSCLDFTFAGEVFEIFLEETLPLLSNLSDSLDNSDLEQVRQSLHALLGSLANVGADATSEAIRLESLAKKIENIDDVRFVHDCRAFISTVLYLRAEVGKSINTSSLSNTRSQ